MFTKGVETLDEALLSNKKYKGLGSFKVVAVNPTMTELSGLYPTRIFDREPDYKSVREDGTMGTRVCFHLQTPFKEETINVSVSYFLFSRPMQNKDNTKVQLVNGYGQSRWVTVEEAKSKQLAELPSNQMPFIGTWKIAHQGEADLLRFIRAYLGTPDPCLYLSDTKSWKAKDGDALKMAEGYLEKKDLDAILAGNVKCLREAIALMPENKVKMLMGVHNSQSGSLQQSVYRFPLKGNTTNYTQLIRDLENAKSNSQIIAGTDYGVAPFPVVECTESYTTFQQTPVQTAATVTDDNFFGPPATSTPPPARPLEDAQLPKQEEKDPENFSDLPF
jgi:hypothetical protein